MVLKQVTLLTPPALATGLDQRSEREPQQQHRAAAIIEHWAQFTPARPPQRHRRADAPRRMGHGAARSRRESERIHKTDLAPEHWSQLKQNPNRAVARRAERLARNQQRRFPPIARRSSKSFFRSRKKRATPRAARKSSPPTARCATCQRPGRKVGPDLTGIDARDRADVLLEILDPNRSVEANYRLWNVTTKDGETFSGRLEAETQTSVEILDTTAQKHVVQRKDIASLEASQLSIMPTGFEALPPDDLKALLEYLAQPHSSEARASEGRAPSSPQR